MSGLFSSEVDLPPEYDGPRSVYVKCEPFENAGVKFWISLCDEIVEKRSDCKCVELEWMSARVPALKELNPMARLAQELDALVDADFDTVMQEVSADLHLMGAPSRVRALLRDAAGAKLTEHVLPDDAVDAETMSFLVSWLLKLAGCDPAGWKEPEVSGVLQAEDRQREWRYYMPFYLQQHAAHEGLLSFALKLYPGRARGN